jgi:tetratricopeptide (TPR) repeat protein
MKQNPNRDRSRELVDEGWDALDSGLNEIAADKARKALELDPLAVDAFVVLAHSDDSRAVRIAVLREGVRNGEIVLAEHLKSWRQADFWLDLDTRPYMRAVHYLGLELWERDSGDDREEATKLIAHLLKINPNDNQGARMLAYGWYPMLGKWDALTALLRRYRKESRTETAFTLALDAWRRGDGKASDYLMAARKVNSHVPGFLLARHAPPPFGGESVAYRSPEEASAYAQHAHAVWRLVPGAIEWLRSNIEA